MYDLVVIGGGPAGLSAAVYAARYKMSVVVLAQQPGGFAATAHKIDNWLGEIDIDGADLANKFLAHLKHFEIPVEQADINAVIKSKEGFLVSTSNGKEFEGKRIVLATGTKSNKLGAKGEDQFLGKGVSYCATCDGFFFRDKDVVVVGGGDSATKAALMLSGIANKVYLVNRSAEMRACEKNQSLVLNHPKIQCILNTQIKEIVGDTVVKKVILSDDKELDVSGVFIEIGSTPASTFIQGLGVKTDESGFVIVDPKQRTNVKGVFAAGDNTTNSDKLKQMITAASEGAISAHNAYLEQKEDK